MKTLIIYVSYHHENTKKLVEGLKEKYPDIEIRNGLKNKENDLDQYDRIGFASGIAFGSFYPQLIKLIKELLPMNKDVFFLYTSGAKTTKCMKSLQDLIKEKNANVLGVFGCRGYDTYGIFKYIGGLSKKHPNSKDIDNAINFYSKL